MNFNEPTRLPSRVRSDETIEETLVRLERDYNDHPRFSTGFIAYCATDEQKEKYINDNCVQLKNMNKGDRSVAKMKVNSNWGFFALNTNKNKHKFIKSS